MYSPPIGLCYEEIVKLTKIKKIVYTFILTITLIILLGISAVVISTILTDPTKPPTNNKAINYLVYSLVFSPICYVILSSILILRAMGASNHSNTK